MNQNHIPYNYPNPPRLDPSPPPYDFSESDNNIENNMNITNDMLCDQVYSYAKTIKFITAINILFTILLIPFYLPTIILIIFPIIGFLGALKYNLPALYIYLFYLFFDIIFKCYQVYYYLYIRNDYMYLALSLVSVIIYMWIFKLVNKFCYLIKSLSNENLLILSQSYKPNRIIFIYY